MTAAAAKRKAAMPVDEPLSAVPGAVVDMNVHRFLPDQAGPSLHLSMLLGEATGRLRMSGAGGFVVNDGEHSRTLADIDEGVLEAIVRRMTAAYPGVFTLDAPVTGTVHDRLDEHFGRAQRRWRAERGQ
jgi:hypothetical protein